MRFVLWVVSNSLALLVAIWLIHGITLTGDSTGQKALHLLATGAVFGLVNAIVKPVVKLFALPFVILSLGLLLFVINALMLLLTSKIAGGIHLGFHVDGFWTAVLGSIVISITGMVLESVLGDR